MVVQAVGQLRVRIPPRARIYQVQQLQTDLLASGGRDDRPLAAKTVANTQVFLHKALADAVRLGLLDHTLLLLSIHRACHVPT